MSSDRSGGNGLNLLQGEFRCDIREEILTERVAGHTTREVVIALNLEVFRRHMDNIFVHMV